MGVLRDVDDRRHATMRRTRSGVRAATSAATNGSSRSDFPRALDDPKTGEDADLFDNGLALVGTVDTVTRQVEHLLKRLPIRWVFAWMYNGLMPHDRLMKTIELFWTKVMPRVSDLR